MSNLSPTQRIARNADHQNPKTHCSRPPFCWRTDNGKDSAVRTIPLLSGFFQISYVTKDLEAGMRLLAAIHGIERFRVKHDVPSLPGMPKMVLHMAHVFVDATQIELIQPAGGHDSLYRDFCAEAAGALRHHHFGLWVDDAAEYESLPAVLAGRNIPLVFNSSIPGVGGAIYADTRATLGHYLEYVHLATDVKGAYYADVPRYGSAGK